MDYFFKNLVMAPNIKSLYYKGKFYTKKELIEKVNDIQNKNSESNKNSIE